MQIHHLIRRSVICCVLVSSQLFIIPALFAASSDTEKLKILSTFLNQLETKHPLFKVGTAEIEASKARALAASQPLYNPEIELDSERVGFNNQDIDSVTVGVNQTIDWHDKRSARENIAVHGQHITQFEQQNIRQQLIAGVFSALADYQIQREVIQAHSKRLSLAGQVLTQATRLYKAGDISKLDLEQFRLSKTQTELVLNQAKTTQATKNQTLSALAGEVRNVWPTLPYAPPNLQPTTLDYEKLLANLPALKAETTRVAKARSMMRLRVREQKPDPTIGLRAGSEESDKIIGLTLSIPLNIRNNYRAEVDEARANIRRAESALQNSRHQLLTQLKSAAQSYHLTYSGWKSWQNIAGKSLQQQRHLLMRLWKAGELSTSDYLLQLNQIKAAELNQIVLKGNVWKAWIHWLATSNQFKQWLNASLRAQAQISNRNYS
ncbi:MAG: TolC family protein [Thiotrichaceae bacterium]